MFDQIGPTPFIVLVFFITTPFYIIGDAENMLESTEITTTDEPEELHTYVFVNETAAPTTTAEPTTITARSTVPLPNFTMPPNEKAKIFRDHFALYNCEMMKQCNNIPKNKTCGRDWYYGTIAWFQNVCTLWKTNCFRLGQFFVQNPAMCEDFHLMYPDKNLWTFTNDMIDPPHFAPLGFNPYYTYPKHKDGLFA